MASTVYHGPNPRFRMPRSFQARYQSKKPLVLQPGRYGCVIEGRYTATPDLTAVGVRKVTWNSKRAVKRRGELLGMRTAFVCWFVASYIQLGGTQKDAVESLTKYPFRRLVKAIKSGRRGLKYLG